MPKTPFIDLVIGGPDMSGTGTQIQDLVEFFLENGKKVRDLRGTEIDILFHTEQFSHWNKDHHNLKSFLSHAQTMQHHTSTFLHKVYELLAGGGTNQDLQNASCVKNNVSTYIDPHSAEIFVLEEPTKRAAGQHNRTIEQNRSEYGSEMDPLAAAHSHSTYRIDEFLRFRGPLRAKNKIIIRSRSEESACYQIYEENYLKNGVDIDYYLKLPGHKYAFGHPPTHIFIVCASPQWTIDEYLQFREQRGKDRYIDDHEKIAQYQILVNYRYATDWLEKLYERGCELYGSKVPKIHRFNMYDSKESIKQEMIRILKEILDFE